ncbi:uncharacterized protein KGF55_002610 [Candida pseudojiufengensis]|uniref:uncharacterized protein n=1 Tax=Candida pseudojiufengensis TaxID=497109 RepID=UPI0022245128|nr:uncharacterized protein KGF55_002610 [Candida pseudojiufengensis]KAI5963730.1 hypothetical protein KGF55_002610 [Candida pseudojiufengensis]
MVHDLQNQLGNSSIFNQFDSFENMEKLVNFPYEVLEMIFQQINHHMVIALMPLHSKFNEIGQKKLYKNIHIYLKHNLLNGTYSESREPPYKQENRWRFHKNILNDFTKKFTVISSCSFYDNIIKLKMNRYQHIEHLSIENLELFHYATHLKFQNRKGVPTFLRKIFRYFKNLDYVSFALSNNQLNRKNKDKTDDGLIGKTFIIPRQRPDFYDHVLFLEEKNQGSYDFLYNNLKSLKFQFDQPKNDVKRLTYHDLSKSIDLFNKINLFKKLEELHLIFELFINLMDPLLLERLNKINCKLKKLDLMFRGKHRFIEDDDWDYYHSTPRPGTKWLFTLDKFFETKEINTLSLNYRNEAYFKDLFIFENFKFEEMLTNANLSKLRNLILSSRILDLKSIDVSKLHKLIICTDVANDMYAKKIAKLYFINPNLRLSWWPRLNDWIYEEIFFYSDNLQLFTPDYFQIISCQWPSYFFKSDIISITKKHNRKTRSLNDKYSQNLSITLKHDYSVEELYGMDMFEFFHIDKPTLKIFEKHEQIFLGS